LDLTNKPAKPNTWEHGKRQILPPNYKL